MRVTPTLLSLAGSLLLGGILTLVPGGLPESEVTPAPGVIRVIEHAGYFETHGSTYGLEAGTYTFEVENRSGKDAGFVLAPAQGDPHVIGIAEGETGTLEVELGSGEFTYYCPLIPTPPYPLSVQ